MEQRTPAPTIYELASLYRLDLLTSMDLVHYAERALEQGASLDAFVELAAETSPGMSTAGPLFERVLQELKVPIPMKLEAQLRVAQYYAKAIVSGDLSPYEGAQKIWWGVANQIENSAEILRGFVGAASEIEDLPERYANEKYDPSPNIEAHEKDILEAAERLLKVVDPSELLSKQG